MEFCEAAVNFIEIYYGKDISSVLKDKFLMHMTFSDVQNSNISAAAALGVTSGTGNNIFTPRGMLTREQAATMLCNVLDVIGFDTSPPPSVLWTDATDIASWAQASVDVMYRAKIMGGTNLTSLVFSPKAPYTHEQSIVTFVNLWKYINK